MADPGFIQKMVLEASFASLASLVYEYRLRGEKFKDELDLVLINTLGMAMATVGTVWLLAPSRSYGSIQKFPWQQMIEGLPNCVFDASGPLKHFTKRARAAGFVAKMAELSAVGALTGTVTSLLSSASVALRQRSNPEWQPSTPVPDVGRSSAGLAAFFAINANVRWVTWLRLMQSAHTHSCTHTVLPTCRAIIQHVCTGFVSDALSACGRPG